MSPQGGENAQRAPGKFPFVVVMGVCGCGKSTIGSQLASAINADFIEGDDCHPPKNVAHMSKGLPLDDQMREPWLRRIVVEARDRRAAGRAVVASCSSLKRSYRNVLREADGDALVVCLVGRRQLLLDRLNGRQGHFMPASLLDSQLATIELPGADEYALEISIETAPARIVECVAATLRGDLSRSPLVG